MGRKGKSPARPVGARQWTATRRNARGAALDFYLDRAIDQTVLCRLAQIGPRSIGRSCHRSSWRSSSGRGSTSPRRLRAGNAYLALDHHYAVERLPPPAVGQFAMAETLHTIEGAVNAAQLVALLGTVVASLIRIRRPRLAVGAGPDPPAAPAISHRRRRYNRATLEMSTRPTDAAHAAVKRRPLSPRQQAKISRSKFTRMLISRGRPKDFVSRAVASRPSGPPSRPTTLAQFLVFDWCIIPFWNHNHRRCRPYFLRLWAPGRQRGCGAPRRRPNPQYR